MSEVVPFSKREEPHLSGPAKCLGCGHTWQAVSPIGVIAELECSSCGADKGVHMSSVWPSDGVLWQCNCGSTVFCLTPHGAPLCINCGVRAVSWAEG